MQTRTLSRTYARPASGAYLSVDLYNDFALSAYILWGMTLTLRGTMTSTGGGAISGFHRDAPAGLIQNVRLYGQYRPWRRLRDVVQMPFQQLYWAGGILHHTIEALLRVSAGAAATDPFRATVPVPFRDPHFRRAGLTYIDVRDYSSLKLDFQNFAVDADLATTNLASVQAVEVGIDLEVIEKPSARKMPHFEPQLVYNELPIDTSSAELSRSGDLNWAGYATSLLMQQHDESAAGDLERVNGILRNFQIQQGAKNLVDQKRWDDAFRASFKHYPQSMSITENAGLAAIPLSPPWDGKRGTAFMKRDTSGAVPPGVTAVTPAAGDSLFTTLLSAIPVFGAERALKL